MQTLLCYFDCQHNTTLVAETLGVHVNTVRHRLEILRVMTGGWVFSSAMTLRTV